MRIKLQNVFIFFLFLLFSFCKDSSEEKIKNSKNIGFKKLKTEDLAGTWRASIPEDPESYQEGYRLIFLENSKGIYDHPDKEVFLFDQFKIEGNQIVLSRISNSDQNQSEIILDIKDLNLEKNQSITLEDKENKIIWKQIKTISELRIEKEKLQLKVDAIKKKLFPTIPIHELVNQEEGYIRNSIEEINSWDSLFALNIYAKIRNFEAKELDEYKKKLIKSIKKIECKLDKNHKLIQNRILLLDLINNDSSDSIKTVLFSPELGNKIKNFNTELEIVCQEAKSKYKASKTNTTKELATKKDQLRATVKKIECKIDKNHKLIQERANLLDDIDSLKTIELHELENRISDFNNQLEQICLDIKKGELKNVTLKKIDPNNLEANSSSVLEKRRSELVIKIEGANASKELAAIIIEVGKFNDDLDKAYQEVKRKSRLNLEKARLKNMILKKIDSTLEANSKLDLEKRRSEIVTKIDEAKTSEALTTISIEVNEFNDDLDKAYQKDRKSKRLAAKKNQLKYFLNQATCANNTDLNQKKSELLDTINGIKEINALPSEDEIIKFNSNLEKECVEARNLKAKKAEIANSMKCPNMSGYQSYYFSKDYPSLDSEKEELISKIDKASNLLDLENLKPRITFFKEALNIPCKKSGLKNKLEGQNRLILNIAITPGVERHFFGGDQVSLVAEVTKLENNIDSATNSDNLNQLESEIEVLYPKYEKIIEESTNFYSLTQAMFEYLELSVSNSDFQLLKKSWREEVNLISNLDKLEKKKAKLKEILNNGPSSMIESSKISLEEAKLNPRWKTIQSKLKGLYDKSFPGEIN